jgi:hypothetical protein
MASPAVPGDAGDGDHIATLTAGPLLAALLLAAAFTLLVAVVPRLASPAPRAVLGALAAAAFFGTAFPGFVLVAAAGYGLLRIVHSTSQRSRRWRAALAAIVLLGVAFTAGRALGWGTLSADVGGQRWVLYALDMWLVLRLVTVSWEVGSRKVAMPSAAGYAAWVCLPLTLAGPLVRYSELPAAVAPDRSVLASRAWWSDLAQGGVKMIAGLALASAPPLFGPEVPQARLINGLAVALLVGPVGFYLTYAGFFHVVQALGRAAGVPVPDSFNWALGRENIAAFWANWNMTATRVFRDYLFYARWGSSRHRPFLNTLILFTLVGLWHDVHPYWILWGFLHGCLFCAYVLWRRVAPAPRGTRAGRIAAGAFTYVCVCACWYLPSKILQGLGWL